MEAQSLNHCTAREVPVDLFFFPHRVGLWEFIYQFSQDLLST